jgi:hypothetical protein
MMSARSTRLKFRCVAFAATILALGSAGLADAEVVEQGDLRISFEGEVTPKGLPRSGWAPVHVAVATKIASIGGGAPSQLRTISIAINRFGRFDQSGLPVCTIRDIQPATTANALKACGGSLVGFGAFKAEVLLGQQAPFPSTGKLYAFSGRVNGRPAILAHVYGTQPVPISFTFPFSLRKTKGTYGTVLTTSFPGATGNGGYITGISLDLGKVFRSEGRTHSFLSATCPAPEGFPAATFPFARASLGFAGRTVTSVLIRNCKAEEDDPYRSVAVRLRSTHFSVFFP